MASVLVGLLAIVGVLPAAGTRHMKELLYEFDTAMLVTRTEDGGLRSRPLSVVHNDDDQGRFYFSTAIDSPKVRELETDPSVNVCMQDKRRFVSVTGGRPPREGSGADRQVVVRSLEDLVSQGEGRSFVTYPDCRA
jgi:hypothetical protein